MSRVLKYYSCQLNVSQKSISKGAVIRHSGTACGRSGGVCGLAGTLRRKSPLAFHPLSCRRGQIEIMKILRLNPRLIPPRPFFRRAGYASRARSYKTLRPLSSVHSAQRRPPQEQSPLLKHSKDGSPVPNTNESSLPVEAISQALRDTNAADNTLLAPVHIAKDPNAILTENHPATHILANSAIVVKRKLELMNVLLGFEQANQYMILDPQGNHLGYIAERDLGTGNRVARQVFTTHRSFTAHVFDKDGKEVLRVRVMRGTKL